MIHLNRERFAFGSFAGSLRPPQLVGVFVVKATLQLRPGEPATWAGEPELVSGDTYADADPTKALRYPSDFAVFKPRADVLFVGHAHAPGGQPLGALRVRLAVGRFSKALAVAGERTWRPSLSRGSSFSLAQPFTKMPLGYEFAYGGPGFERNPVGRGHKGDPAPNLADPAKPDAREPVSFGPLSPAWPQRRSLVGTYKGDYVKKRWPWFPEDFDWGYFNAAPRDQQLDGYLRGDEDITLEHLHPQYPLLRSKLPGERVRCFFRDRGPTGERRFREAQLTLDTLWIDGDAGKLVLVWRGTADVRTPKMREIDDIWVVTEPLVAAPRPADEYRVALQAQPAPVAPAPAPPAAPLPDADPPELERAMAELEAEFAAIDRQAAPYAAEAERLAAAHAAQLPAGDADLTPAAILARVAEMAAAASRASPDHARHFAEIDLESMKQAGADFQALEDDLAQDMQAVPDADRWTRERVAAAAAGQQPMTDLDLSGLDLSGLDLSGCDLSRSRLTGTDLHGGKLVRANLTAADLTGANLQATDLSGATLADADLTGAGLAGAKLTHLAIARATLAGLNLAGADLTGGTGREANFAKANLAGACLVGASLPAADFRGATLAKAVCTAADFTAAQFQGARARGIELCGAKLQRVQADEGADFSGGQFRDADAAKAVFDTANLDGADFRRANLAAAQLEGASLRGANFDRANLAGTMLDSAILQQAVLTHANLLRATLEGADLTGANLQRANLFEAGFWLAAIERADLRDANRKGTLLG